MLFFEILGLVSVSALLSRYVRQAPSAEAFRTGLANSSRLLKQLLACPHCLSFWIAVVGTGLLWWWRPRDPLELGLLVLLGWRGAWFINRSIDQRREQTEVRATQSCTVCGKPWLDGASLERGSQMFCSTTCWFDYLRNRPTSRRDLIDRDGTLLRQEMYPVSYANVTNAEAHQLLQSEQGYVYVDVRSVPEFSNGHPAGAVNVPVFHKEAMGMVPNPDFLTVMEAHYEHDTKLLIGCQSGRRSLQAAEALVASGFTDVTNVKGGYGGVKDATGQSVEAGWFEQGLPTDYGEPDERSYAALAGQRRDGGPS